MLLDAEVKKDVKYLEAREREGKDHAQEYKVCWLFVALNYRYVIRVSALVSLVRHRCSLL